MSIVDIERYISFLQDNYTEISDRDRVIFKHLYHETFLYEEDQLEESEKSWDDVESIFTDDEDIQEVDRLC